MRKGGNAWWGYDPFSDKKQRSLTPFYKPLNIENCNISEFPLELIHSFHFKSYSGISIKFRTVHWYHEKKVDCWSFPFGLNKSTLNSELHASAQAHSLLSLQVKLIAEITFMNTFIRFKVTLDLHSSACCSLGNSCLETSEVSWSLILTQIHVIA